MFTPRSFVEIVAGMIRHMKATQKAVTDFHIGSVARTLVEAPAVEMDEMYQEMAQGVTDAIPVALYTAFDFDVLPAAAAGGVVRISSKELVDQPITILAGTLLKRSSPTLEYRTLADATIAHGTTYVDTAVVAVLPGVAGNAPIGTAFTVTSNVAGTIAVSSVSRLTGGAESEDPAERKSRFIDYIGALSRGTIDSVVYGVSQAVVRLAGVVIERVARTGVVETPGHVFVYISGSHGAPSAALLSAAQLAIDGGVDLTGATTHGYRPAGVRIDALPTDLVTVDVSFTITLFNGQPGGAMELAALQTNVSALMAGILPGSVLYVSALIDAALAVPGVKRAVCGNVENVLCAHHNALIMGQVTVEYVNA